MAITVLIAALPGSSHPEIRRGDVIVAYKDETFLGTEEESTFLVVNDWDDAELEAKLAADPTPIVYPYSRFVETVRQDGSSRWDRVQISQRRVAWDNIPPAVRNLLEDRLTHVPAQAGSNIPINIETEASAPNSVPIGDTPYGR